MNKVVVALFFLLLHVSSSVSDKPKNKPTSSTPMRLRSNKIVAPPRKPISENFRMRMVKEVDFNFTFYNKNKPNGVELLKEHYYQTAVSDMDKTKPVRFITHGWKATCKQGLCTELKDEYMKNENEQVIVADWETLSNELEYFELIEQSGDISVIFAKVLIPAVQTVGGKNIHIVAHGVGAHLGGVAAELTTTSTNEIIGRVTALDPSWPSYEIPSYGIQRSQAKFVDVYHTSAGLSGIPEPRGHVDFYPNGGTAPQPGCQKHFMNTAQGVCSSNLSWGWFRSTINGQSKKVGYRCVSWKTFTVYYCSFTDTIPFGQKTPASARGVFHLKISDWPFEKNKTEDGSEKKRNKL